MPKSPDTSTVIENQGKTIVVVPKPIAEALGLEAGQKIKWRATGKKRLEFEVQTK